MAIAQTGIDAAEREEHLVIRMEPPLWQPTAATGPFSVACSTCLTEKNALGRQPALRGFLDE
jgi:hypothetical protein